MTHGITGNIVSSSEFSGRNIEIANQVVAQWMLEHGSYHLYQNRGIEDTYCPEREETQPTIVVFTREEILRDWRDLRYLLVKVRSDSRVDIGNTREAQQIYDATKAIRQRLGREMSNKKLEMIFDDEKRFYLPTDFRKAIRKARAEAA